MSLKSDLAYTLRSHVPVGDIGSSLKAYELN